MLISNDQIRHVSRLARLKLTGTEEEKLSSELAGMLSYVQQLQQVNTDEVVVSEGEVVGEDVLRVDVSEESLSRNEALMNAPVSDGEFFVVPRIIKR